MFCSDDDLFYYLFFAFGHCEAMRLVAALKCYEACIKHYYGNAWVAFEGFFCMVLHNITTFILVTLCCIVAEGLVSNLLMYRTREVDGMSLSYFQYLNFFDMCVVTCD